MLEEALNITQRQKRAMIAKRNKQKLTRSRQIAARKLAPDSIIKKRAYALARKILRKRIAGGRGAQYQELGPTEKEAIDKQLDSRKALIKKIALRLIPRIKQSEQHRLQSFLKGKAMKNINEAKEELNDKFKKTFKKKKKETGFIKILNKFAEEAEYDSKAYRSLVKKAEKYNVDIDYVAEIYNSAFNDYDNVDTPLTEQQYAFSRVNQALNEIKYLHRNEKDYVTHEKPLDSIGDFSVGSWTKAKATSLAKKHNGRVIQTLIKGRHKIALNERNKENKFKKDLYVVKKGIERAKLNHFNVNNLADRSKHDYHINYSSDNDDASHRHSSRKTNIRLLKNIGRSAIRNEENLHELSKDTYDDYIDAASRNRRKEFMGKQNRVTMQKRKIGIERADRLKSKINEASPYHSAGVSLEKLALNTDASQDINNLKYHARLLKSTNKDDHKISAQSLKNSDTYIRDSVANAVHKKSSKKDSEIYHNHAGLKRLDEASSEKLKKYVSKAFKQNDKDRSKGINIALNKLKIKHIGHNDAKVYAKEEKLTRITEDRVEDVKKITDKTGHEAVHDILIHHGFKRHGGQYQKGNKRISRHISPDSGKAFYHYRKLSRKNHEEDNIYAWNGDDKGVGHAANIHHKLNESSSRAAIMDKIKAANSNLLKIKDGTHKREAERQREIRKNEKAYNNSSREVEKYHSDKVKEHKKLYLHHKKEWQNHEDMKHDLYNGNLGYHKNDHEGIRGAEEEISYQQGHHEKKMMHHHEMMHKHNSYLDKPHKLDESQVAQHGKLVKSYKTAKGHPFDLFHKGDTHTLIRRDNSQISDIYTGKTTRELHKSLLKRFLPEETSEHPIVKEYKHLKSKSIKDLRDMISRTSRVVDVSEFKSKDHAASHILRAKHGNKKVADAFGLKEQQISVLEAKQFRYIISGVHQDQGHVRTKAYYADSHDHAKQQFIDDHGDAYHYFKIKKLTYPKLRGESVETQAQKIKKINDKFRRQVKNNQSKLEKNKQAALKEVLGPENQIGTPALTKKLKKATPGQENAQINESHNISDWQTHHDKFKQHEKARNALKNANGRIPLEHSHTADAHFWAMKAHQDVAHSIRVNGHVSAADIERAHKLSAATNLKEEINESNAPYIHYSVVLHHPEKKLHKVIKFSERSKDYWHDDRVGWKLPHPAGIGATIDNHPEIKKHKAEGWHQVELGGSASHSKKSVLENARKVLLRQKTMSKYKDYKLAEELDLDEVCWDGYKQIGMKKKGKKIVPNCVKEDVKSAEAKGVVVPAYVDADGNTIPAKVVKRKTGKKILSTENPFDGK